MTVRAVTANTQGKSDSLADFRATVAAVRDRAPAFVGWQEVKSARQSNALRVGMGDGYSHHHTDLAVPISVSRGWTVVREGRKQAHKGRAGASPARWIVWVIARHVETRQVAVFVNTHMVSGAWNNKPKLFKAWRRQMWTDHWQALRDVVAGAAKKWPVVVVGDFNRVDVKPFHPDLRWADNRGIDKVAVIGDLEPVRTAARVTTRSDHDARVVDLTVKESR